jgi:hypothetical protein
VKRIVRAGTKMKVDDVPHYRVKPIEVAAGTTGEM